MRKPFVRPSNAPNKPPNIIDERRHAIPDVNLGSNKPVRAVLFVEVKGMEQARVIALLRELDKNYEGAKGGKHYIVPIRDGKITSDVLFEQEWEKVVQEMFEIRDGQIKLKNGATETIVIRQKI